MFETRRVVSLGGFFAAVLATGLVAGCTGDKGDAGPAGPAGPPGSIGSSAPPSGDAAAAFATATPIKHVVIIFGENISFDHYFATYPQVPKNLLDANKNPILVDPNTCQPTPLSPLVPVDGLPFTAKANTPMANNLLTPLDVNNGFSLVANAASLPKLCANPNFLNTANSGVNGKTGTGGPGSEPTAPTAPFRLASFQAVTQDQGHNYMPEQQASHGGAMDLFPLFTGHHDPAAPGGSDAATTGLVMGYYDGTTVTGFWNYAQNFAMNDNSWTTQFGPSTPGAINLISGQTNGMTGSLPNLALSGFSPNHVVADGQGGFTLIGDTDPLNDVCSTSGEQNLMAGKNIGDLLNAANISWGAFMGGFDLSVTNPNGSAGCGRLTNPTPALAVGGASQDYIPHHAWFQYYASTANPTHARPSSLAAIGSSKTADGTAADPANHNYDSNDFFLSIAAGNLPAVSFVKAPAFQDGHGGYSDPIDEQVFDISVINALQHSQFWATTAVIIAYDDSDGWYDHQAPPILNASSLAAIGSPTGVAASNADQLNGAGVCSGANAQQGKAAAGMALPGATTTHPVLGRCGYGTRVPLMVISPLAKKNFIDHTLTDQSSVLKFIEDNWLQGTRIGNGSFDVLAGSIEGMFSFPASAQVDAPRTLFLEPETGLELDK